MAGNCRPAGAGQEVPIFIDAMVVDYGTEKNHLINGIRNTDVYHNAILMQNHTRKNYFIFTIGRRCNIWAITGKHRDGGGYTTDQPVELYRLSDGTEKLLGCYPTVGIGRNFDVWYELFHDLQAGTYKAQCTSYYVGFQELYGESAGTERLYWQYGKAYGMRLNEV